MELGLADRVALVTGSRRGTGAGIAEGLAREGASVRVHGFEPGQADVVVERLREAGLEVSDVTGDISTDQGAEAVARRALDCCGRVDVLVNNYGVAEGGRWLDTSTDDWVGIYQKNVLAGVRLVQHLTPGMRARGRGRVIWLGTVGGLRPAARMPHCCASKAVLLEGRMRDVVAFLDSLSQSDRSTRGVRENQAEWDKNIEVNRAWYPSRRDREDEG